MKIVVCIKQVPSTNKVQLHPETNTIIRDGRKSVTNPFDTYAIEEAIRIKEKTGGKTIAISMGIPETEKLLKDAMGRGIDQAILLSDKAFAGSDTLATSYTLSLGIRELMPVDLILCGKMAVDGDTAQIGPELAEQLGIPHVTDVIEILEMKQSYLICKREIDNGYQLLKVKLPALLTVLKDINMPRMPSIEGVLQSETIEVIRKDARDLEAKTSKLGLSGSPTQVVKTFVPERDSKAIEISGNIEEKAAKVKNIIGEVLGNGRSQD
ncbi:electron transfer flavoprotein subunit beta/FixA family protein [Tindallia californiensis]|uniref:Electron transfer flavoprotein small subunit n=1 Tax=Tindallia californiensis TaxID=159292 RepID=A0A1H3MX89_9FIRM|nr:electron transfer flavoprotein subunit beta/FixA family protein [Tindallia californiensis]SDY81103.1 electron transfer flavoprotein beta subunit [Tindallia californiensis]